METAASQGTGGGCDRSREGLREPGIFQDYECLRVQIPSLDSSRGFLEVRGGHYWEVGLWAGGFSPPFRTPHHMQKSIRVHGAWRQLTQPAVYHLVPLLEVPASVSQDGP